MNGQSLYDKSYDIHSTILSSCLGSGPLLHGYRIPH